MLIWSRLLLLPTSNSVTTWYLHILYHADTRFQYRLISPDLNQGRKEVRFLRCTGFAALFCAFRGIIKKCTPLGSKCTPPTDLSLKSIAGKNEKGSAATISESPQSLLSLKSIGKPLQIGAFAKRNWTPASILIVSKLVSSYGRGRKTRTLDTRFWRPLLYQLSYAPTNG